MSVYKLPKAKRGELIEAKRINLISGRGISDKWSGETPLQQAIDRSRLAIIERGKNLLVVSTSGMEITGEVEPFEIVKRQALLDELAGKVGLSGNYIAQKVSTNLSEFLEMTFLFSCTEVFLLKSDSSLFSKKVSEIMQREAFERKKKNPENAISLYSIAKQIGADTVRIRKVWEEQGFGKLKPAKEDKDGMPYFYKKDIPFIAKIAEMTRLNGKNF